MLGLDSAGGVPWKRTHIYIKHMLQENILVLQWVTTRLLSFVGLTSFHNELKLVCAFIFLWYS